ncbi:MAG: PDZ domain-containing protein, partial [Firmicutes bacterium]|nr:PDZ domain-containing protein [Bacillota bacterium]
IYYLDDTKITDSAQLVSLIQKHNIGDKVTFTVVRNNEMIKIDVELEESQPEQVQQTTEG